METNFLFQAVIYLMATVLCVPITTKLGMSSILGYLFAGIIIGPFVLGLISQEGQNIMHFAEFGIVMMLFLIGLEIEPLQFWKMRKVFLGMGFMQLLGTSIAIFIGCLLFTDWNWKIILIISLTLTLSSTAIVLQNLAEKGLQNSPVGRSLFAVLIFQDIAVIPILALLPVLASSIPESSNEIYQSIIISFPSWIQGLIIITIILIIYFSGRYLFELLFKFIAKTRLQELFTVTSLLLVVSISCLMNLIGLSPALGTFLAGVVLANSEYRHEIKSDIAPFKGLLLGLFFISIGVSINFKLILENLGFILIFGALLTFIKLITSYITSRVFKKKKDQNISFAISLSQAGEFGFVIMGISLNLKIIPAILGNQIMAIIALTMIVTPFLQLVYDRFIFPNLKFKENQIEDECEYLDDCNSVIIAGFGYFGSTVGRLLRANNIESTILDNDSDQIVLLRKMGFKAHYGDATRLEILESAGCKKAKLFISAVDDPKVNLQIIEMLRIHYPNLKILTRAKNRIEAYELIDLQVEHVYREYLYSAVSMGVDVLVELGIRKYTATRQALQFIKNDEIATYKLAKKRYNKKTYLTTILAEMRLQKKLLKNDLKSQKAATNHSWDSEDLKKKWKNDTNKKRCKN